MLPVLVPVFVIPLRVGCLGLNASLVPADCLVHSTINNLG
jgi:hypothetical protein